MNARRWLLLSMGALIGVAWGFAVILRYPPIWALATGITCGMYFGFVLGCAYEITKRMEGAQ